MPCGRFTLISKVSQSSLERKTAVSWLRQLKNPTGQVARWIQEIETYDLVVQHRAGLKHTNADALSRRPCKVCERQERLSAEAEAEIEPEPEEEPVPQTTAGADKDSIVVRDIHSASTSHSSQVLLDGWSTEEVRNSQLQDDDICQLVTALETGSGRPRWDQVSSGRAALKTFWRQWDKLKIQDGLLYCLFCDTDLEEDYSRLVVQPVQELTSCIFFMTFLQLVT